MTYIIVNFAFLKTILLNIIHHHSFIKHQVVLGGGRSKFLRNGTVDPEYGLITNGRLDKDLVEVSGVFQH